MGETERRTEVLSLFLRDLTLEQRVTEFKSITDELRVEVDKLATPDNVAAINENYNLTLIFNWHGDAIHAGQSVRAVKDPFITFVESVGKTDISENKIFNLSLQNAFDVDFNNGVPYAPEATLNRDNAWSYWRDRGLLAKASLIVPVDYRYYSSSLVDSLVGQGYNARFLNSPVAYRDIVEKPFAKLLEDTKNKGLIIMHSNALRELTTTRQIIKTLMMCLNPKGEHTEINGVNADKLIALAHKRRDENGKLNASVFYGSAHHSMLHIFRGIGINAERIFPAVDDYPRPYKAVGPVNQQFFSRHPFGISEEQADLYARQFIIEGILLAPLEEYHEFGCVPESHQQLRHLWLRLARTARRPELVDNVEKLVEDFKADPKIAVKILSDFGIQFRQIGE